MGVMDVNSWELQFESCDYSDRLISKLSLLNSIVKNPVDITEVKKAIYYAKKYHGNQLRQSGEPYYSHPLEVAYMFAEYAAAEDQRYFRTDLVVTAVLHDTIEDTQLTFEMIKSIFGTVVAGQVMDLTRLKEDGRKISSAEMLESLWLQKKTGLSLIKLIDRLHNMQTVQIKSEEKIQKIVNETFNSFLVFAIHAQYTNLEKVMYNLCCKALSIEAASYELSHVTQDASHLTYLEDTDTHQSVSQVFQNVTSPIKN